MRFRYKDRVILTTGFYEGCIGTLISAIDVASKDAYGTYKNSYFEIRLDDGKTIEASAGDLNHIDGGSND